VELKRFWLGYQSAKLSEYLLRLQPQHPRQKSKWNNSICMILSDRDWFLQQKKPVFKKGMHVFRKASKVVLDPVKIEKSTKVLRFSKNLVNLDQVRTDEKLSLGKFPDHLQMRRAINLARIHPSVQEVHDIRKSCILCRQI